MVMVSPFLPERECIEYNNPKREKTTAQTAKRSSEKKGGGVRPQMSCHSCVFCSGAALDMGAAFNPD
jgi:hypothetical protein